MTRHLASCKVKSALDAEETAKGRKKLKRLYHLRMGAGPYWLHLEMEASRTLAGLDAFLRKIWLECCGHLSEFEIGGGFGSPARSMKTRLEQVLEVGDKFRHTYDFGSSTVLQGRVVGEREGVISEPVRILARNDPPEYTCERCENSATCLCWECGDMLCDACLAEDECGEQETALVITNSPRSGECAYNGKHDTDDWSPLED